MSENTFEKGLAFILTKSHGGPHDDAAFAAGLACGQLWTELRHLAHNGATPRPRYIPAEYVAQFDLIAMHYGYTLKAGEVDEGSGWQRVDFGPGYEAPSAGEQR